MDFYSDKNVDKVILCFYLSWEGPPVEFNHTYFCISSKGIKWILLTLWFFLVKKGDLWEPEIVIFQTPRNPLRYPSWDPRVVYYTQETQINVKVQKDFWSKVLSRNMVYRCMAYCLLRFLVFNRGDTVSRRSPIEGVRPSPYTTLCS